MPLPCKSSRGRGQVTRGRPKKGLRQQLDGENAGDQADKDVNRYDVAGPDYDNPGGAAPLRPVEDVQVPEPVLNRVGICAAMKCGPPGKIVATECASESPSESGESQLSEAEQDFDDPVLPCHKHEETLDNGESDDSWEGGCDFDDDDDGKVEEETDNKNNNYDIVGSRPLYRGAPLTVSESALSITTLMLKHNLSASCTEDLMTILGLFCPQEQFIKLTLDKLKTYSDFTSETVNKVYYCSLCGLGLRNQNDVCNSCGEKIQSSYFLQVPLAPQLEKMFARPEFYVNLHHKFTRDVNEGCLEDIYDGQLYKAQIRQGILADPCNFSMTYYIDGVKVSEKHESWLFFLSINELPYKERSKRENILLAGLWFGPSKPEANLFISSFMDDFQSLYQGMEVIVFGLEHPLFIRGFVLAGVADLPAKSRFLNCVPPDAYHGCGTCESRGVTELLPNDNDLHVYPYVEHFQKRTQERMEAQALEAEKQDDATMGVKGRTALRLFMPDFVKGSAMDPMRLVVGIIGKLLYLHFDFNLSQENFSLRPVIHLADDFLLSMKPPKYIHRLPTSIEHARHWHASEKKYWLFYYSVPIYEEIMNPLYFDHYLKFVTALSFLSADSVSVDMIDSAEQLLHEFVREFQSLYGLRYCSIDIHSLLHLPGCVRELGPTWVCSYFPFEDLNGMVVRNAHRKTDVVPLEVARIHSHNLELPVILNSLPDGAVKDYCLQRRGKLKVLERLCGSSYSIGAFSTPTEFDARIVRGLKNIKFVQYRTYNRFKKKTVLFVAESYSCNLKTCSSYVTFSGANGLAYGSIINFVKVLQCKCNLTCQCAGDHYAIVQELVKDSDVHGFNYDIKLTYMWRFATTINIIAVPVRCLRTVCFRMVVNNKLYIALPVNAHEVE